MPNPAITNIRTAVKYGLGRINAGETITTSAGSYTFFNTVQGIGDPPRSPENMPAYPFVNLVMMPETCANRNAGSHESAGANKAILENSFIVSLGCWLKDVNDPHLAQEKMLADLQAYFGLYYWIPDSSGNSTCLNCIYAGSERFGLNTNKPQTGIIVNFQVWYRQLLVNPLSSPS